MLLVTGNEVLRGRIQDANGPALAADLEARGVEVRRVTLVADRLDQLVEEIATPLRQGASMVVVTGGLGPTHDDLTMEALALAAGVELVVDPAARAMVEARTRHLAGMVPPERDRLLDKQASMPEGAIVLPPAGTAPGCVLGVGSALLVALPGPPWEREEVWTRALATEGVMGLLAGAQAAPERTLRLAGVPESRFVGALSSASPADLDRVELGVCARDGELEVVVRGDVDPADRIEGALRGALGDALYSDDGRRVEEVVGDALRRSGERLAVAESCTAGLLGARLTRAAGASDWLLGGVIAYDNAVKHTLLGVPEDMLAEHGAVSEPVAAAMAAGARRALDADWAVSVTGVAGPGGGTPDKPVGLVYVGVAGPERPPRVERYRFAGAREVVRARTAVAAMHQLRRALGA